MRSQLPQFIGNAGAAFRLNEPADAPIEIEHPEGLIVIREGTPYVTVALNEAHDVSSARSVTWRVVQEAFDVFSARTLNALSTSLGEREYILWNREGDVYDLTCVDTIEGQWSVSAQFTTSTVPTTPQVVPFAHHQSLRFYCLSQLTPDLFDAYRNAYLANIVQRAKNVKVDFKPLLGMLFGQVSKEHSSSYTYNLTNLSGCLPRVFYTRS